MSEIDSAIRSRADIGLVQAATAVTAISGAAVAAQMHEVCDRLSVSVAHAALARYGILEG
jgi:hypothetical protein